MHFDNPFRSCSRVGELFTAFTADLERVAVEQGEASERRAFREIVMTHGSVPQ